MFDKKIMHVDDIDETEVNKEPMSINFKDPDSANSDRN